MTQQSNQYWGRKYQVLIVMEDGTTALDISNSEFEPESLRVTFRIETIGYQAYYYGEVTIYNLSGDTEKKIIQEGAKVIIQAGYQKGHYGKIFEGYVFQPIRDRQNVVDYTLTLNCVNQKMILDHNLVKFTANAGLDPRTMIQSVAKQARAPINVGTITDDMEQTTLPRGKVFFGEPKKYFRQIAQGQRAQWWVDEHGVQFGKVTDVPKGEAVVYTPHTGLIGTPQQIDYGCAFRVLLDPRLKISNPPMAVKLDQTLIRQQKARIGQIMSILDQDGIYRVCGVTHTGDTRGNEWYTDVIGVTSGGKIPAQLIGQQIGTGESKTISVPPQFMPDKKKDPN